MSSISSLSVCKPPSARFFSPFLRRARQKAYTRWSLMTAFLCSMILCLLSIYWGALGVVDSKLHELTVLIVDYDTGDLVGPAVRQLAENGELGGLGSVVEIPKTRKTAEKEVEELVKRIYEEQHWAGVVVMSNATMMIDGAASGGEGYDEKALVKLAYVEARQETVLSTYILPRIREFERKVQREVSAAVRSKLTDRPVKEVHPTLLNPSIEFGVLNLRPFGPPVALPAVTVGQIYLIVFSFFSFSFYLPVHSGLLIPPPGTPPLRFTHWILFRIISTSIAYFFFSFFYSLISIFFHIPFTLAPCPSAFPCRGTAYGSASFPVYWALNYVGTLALGFPCENVGMIVGFPYFALWLIFWVITNCAVSFYAIPLAPAFYRYGYAWPVFHIVRGSRTVLFDTYRGRLGVDFAALAGWAVVSIALFPFCCRFAAWKMRRERDRKSEEGVDEKRERRREMEVRRGSVVRTE